MSRYITTQEFNLRLKSVVSDWPDITNLLCKMKCHCTADLLFDWFGFSCFVYVELDTSLVESKPTLTGGQPYSDTSLYKVSEGSLADRHILVSATLAFYI